MVGSKFAINADHVVSGSSFLGRRHLSRSADVRDDVTTPSGRRRPRYVRVNTIKLEIKDFISSFEYEGYRFVPCTTGSYDDYLTQLRDLGEDEFLQDYHVKVIFAFHPDTKLHDHELLLDGKILLQDKATAMSVHLLAPEKSSVILDMCAAPGMKTTQIAAAIQCKGLVYAVERNKDRYQTLLEFINKTNSICVEALHLDAFEIGQHTMGKVEYILLDPSCSGSGMDCHVHSYNNDDGRLESLTALQEKLLRHAMNSFPRAKRIVYSTCSLLPEENERVVKNVVKGTKGKWQVQDVKELLKGQWNNFGAGLPGTIASKCLYAKPDSDLTTGFFLAVINRKQKNLSKIQHLEEMEPGQSTIEEKNSDEKLFKNSKRKANEEFTPADENEMHVEEVSECYKNESKKKLNKKSKKKRKADDRDPSLDRVTSQVNDLLIEEEDTEKKSKDNQLEISKKEKRQKTKDVEVVIETDDQECDENKVKRKSKNKRKYANDSQLLDSVTNYISESFTNQNLCEDTEVSKKKKHKKNVHIIKKRTKKKRDTDDHPLNNVTNESNELNVEGISEEIRHTDDQQEVLNKKKRKKNLHNNELIEVEIQTESESSILKKKKRKVHHE